MSLRSRIVDTITNDSVVRTLLALTVTGLGILGLAAVSMMALSNAPQEQKAEAARLVFASIVPLIGTWVGSVLAYYFTSQNLKAGSDTALAAVTAAGGISPETPVWKVMTSFGNIKPIKTVADDNAARDVQLAGLYGELTNDRARIPIVTSGNHASPLYVVHMTDIEKYSASLTPPVGPRDLTQKLTDMLSSAGADFKGLTSFVVVPESATLAEARAALRAVSGAKDVFVTSSGARNGTVLGWLTNSDLAKSD